LVKIRGAKFINKRIIFVNITNYFLNIYNNESIVSYKSFNNFLKPLY
jgi:hypothetical protein